MKISGAQAIIACLHEQGVDTVFGYPGGTILPLYDALHDSDIRHVLTVHEQGAAHAADGYARASGKVGVCIATSGPGATNLVTGLAAAFMDSVPVVAITGQVATNLIGRDAFQEVDITGITMPITKHNYLVRDLNQLPETLRRAFQIARSGRPGPVLIDVPRDVQTGFLEFTQTEELQEEQLRRQTPTEGTDRIGEAAKLIQAAQRPLMIVGGGAITADVQQELLALAKTCKLPVVSTLMGLGAFPASHPQFLGMTGLHGQRVANMAVHDADLLVAVGSRFSDRVTGDRSCYTDGKNVIHIDIDPAEIDKNVAAHIGLSGDTGDLLAKLNAAAQPGCQREKWWQTIKQWQAANQPVLQSEPLTVPWVMDFINKRTVEQDVIFVTDVGQHQMWAAQCLKIEKPRSWITSGGLGAMGFGLPAAMGAQMAEPAKRVIHIAGDGGFKMTGNELYTIVTHNLPVISIIFNNNCLGMIRQLQKVYFQERYYAEALPPFVDFAAYARAFGAEAATVSTAAEVAAAFEQAWQATGPFVLVVNLVNGQMVDPMLAPGAPLNEFVDF